MARNVFLHLGLMKSGTTLIQSNLFANRAELRSRGLLVPGQTWHDQVVAVIDVLDRTQALRQRKEGAWSAMVEQIRQWDGDAVISMEFLAAAKPAKIEKIVESLDDQGLHLVVTARDITSALPSMWQEMLKNFNTWTWDDYLEAVRDHEGPGLRFWREQDASQVIEAWSAVAPDAPVTLVTVPPRSLGPGELWRRFCGVVGVDPDGLVEAESANTSLGLESMLALRQLNLDLRAAGLARPEYGTVKHTLARSVMGARAASEHKLGLQTPDWLHAEWRRIRSALDAPAITVVGDLDEIAPRDLPGATEADITPEELLAATVDALAGLLVAGTEPHQDPVRGRTHPGSRPSRIVTSGRAAAHRLRRRWRRLVK